ncbi:uncharacterized protein B0T23DRAFT_314404, partial [Neurospora hispaniola]
QNEFDMDHSNIDNVNARALEDARLPPRTNEKIAYSPDDAATSSKREHEFNNTNHLEAFEFWVRSGEWKKFFPFGELVPINSEEVNNFGRPTESRATSDAQMGRSRSLPNFNTARFNQGQALTTQDYDIPGPTHHPGMLNGFPPAHDSGTVHSSDPVNNNGMVDGFAHTSNAAVVQANPHAGPAGVQEQVPLPSCSECKSHPV